MGKPRPRSHDRAPVSSACGAGPRRAAPRDLPRPAPVSRPCWVASRSRMFAGARSVLAAALVAASAGCAAPGSEIHLAPFYSRHSTAHGTRETEALGGFMHSVYDSETDTLLGASVRPFYGWRNEGGGEWHADILVPLGMAQRRDG